ncbi:MAG: hypothetical protein NWQ31_04965 [Polaribacter sp.]|nr:hypothetical protein [Polaribacter sp.]
MKNLIKKETLLFSICILIHVQLFCQVEKEKTFTKDAGEIRIDALDFVLFTAIEMTYERVQDNDTGYGLSVYVNPRSEDTFYEKFVITPFFRLYFLSDKEFGSNGYFVEFYSKFASGKNYEIDFYNDTSENYFDISLGIGIGRKWIHKKGFTLETSFGIGRNLGFDKNSPDFAIRGGVALGYRF